jgi:hypothetical protein
MIRLLFLSLVTSVSLQVLNAQELKNPLANKESNVSIPASPGDDMAWVKPHWEFIDGDYAWISGAYIENLEFHTWKDGYWERNQKTGWWVFNAGYWQRADGNMQFTGEESSTNTISEDPIEKKSVFINISGLAKN